MNYLPFGRIVGIAILGLCLATPMRSGPKLGLLLKAPDGFWAEVTKGAIEESTKQGAELVVKAPLHESDVSVQIRLLNALVGQGVEAIIVAPCNKEAMAAPVASAAVHGVKVIVIDTPLNGTVSPVFIGTDHEAAGRTAGEILAGLVGETDEVALFRYSQTSGATMQRDSASIVGFRGKRPNATIYSDIYAGSEPGTEAEKAIILLQKHPTIKAVLATATAGTLGMLKALNETQRAGSIKLVGFGYNLPPAAAQALANGSMSAWIAQQPREIGAKGVASAISVLKNEPVPAVVHTGVVVVTKANLNEPKIQALAN